MPHNCRAWEKHEEDFIRDNYTNLSDSEIGEVLNRSLQSIKAKRERLGLFWKISSHEYYRCNP